MPLPATFRTFGDLNAELIDELDLEDEVFVDQPELIRIWNRAVGIAEGHLITLGLKDKYLLTRATLDIVTGQEAYPLPAALFGNKIIKMIYAVGATFYTVLPLESKDMFENYVFLNHFTTTDFYRYFIEHDIPGQQNLILVPSGRDNQPGAITFWFSRSANRYSVDSDICDLPGPCYEFLNAYVTEKIYKKESHANFEDAKAYRMEQEQLMQSVLSGQIPDNAMSVMEPDLSAYQESS